MVRFPQVAADTRPPVSLCTQLLQALFREANLRSEPVGKQVGTPLRRIHMPDLIDCFVRIEATFLAHTLILFVGDATECTSIGA
jgi:hypothetical protein